MAESMIVDRMENCDELPRSSNEKCDDIPASPGEICDDIPATPGEKCDDIPASADEKCDDIPASADEKCDDIPASADEKCDDIPASDDEGTSNPMGEASPTDQSPTEGQEPPMSKRKRKRLERQLIKKSFMKERRIKERERKKQRLKEAKAQGIDTGPSRRSLKHNTMTKSSCRIRTVIDCSFDDLMTDKDMKSIVKQVNFCYASNRRSVDPLQFSVSSFNKRLKDLMDSIGDYHRWDVNLEERSYLETFDKDEIVYLTSDSKNILRTLEEDKVYIIGGLVDHNHHKGVCLKLAEEKGLAHAQLPIGDYVALESRNVLAINHVFEILLRFTESHDWEDAFYKVIPQRKILSTKDTKTKSNTTHPGEGTATNDCDNTDGLPVKHARLENIENDCERSDSEDREEEHVNLEPSEPS